MLFIGLIYIRLAQSFKSDKMKKSFLLILTIALFLTASAQPFNSYQSFIHNLDSITKITDNTQRDAAITKLWNWLKTNDQIPFRWDKNVAFIYKGTASKVYYAGDMNGWGSSSESYDAIKQNLSNIWLLEKEYPIDARLDYKLILNGNNWIMDPDNPHLQMSGFGNNSELRMPGWEPSPYITLGAGVNRGLLSNDIRIKSSNLGYDVQYKVYIPFGYDNLFSLPVMYVTDGHEYANNQMGSMVIVLDNLIHLEYIKPIIVVFIDPRNPDNLSQNRRAVEYTGNSSFANFVADELVPLIDANYKTNPTADARGILGTSYGGNNASYFGVKRSDVFHLIAPQSPAFFDETFSAYQTSDLLPLKTYITTGVIYDTEDKANKMVTILENKGYEYKITKVNEGHSWGNWRALLDDMLINFFSDNGTQQISNSTTEKLAIFPNPTKNSFSVIIPSGGVYSLEWYDVLGRCVYKIPHTEPFIKNQEYMFSVPFTLTKGIYQLQLRNNTHQFTMRVLLN